MTSLGFIETRGLVAAIEGADAMLKAAEVRLLEKNLAGGGLVTISVTGEVSAVRAAVDAAVAAIQRIHGAQLVSEHVIARPYAELAGIIAVEPGGGNNVSETPDLQKSAHEEAVPDGTDGLFQEGVSEDTVAQTMGQSHEVETGSEAPAPEAASQKVDPQAHVRFESEQLKKMSLHKLRQMARTLRGLALSPEQIASADKKALIEAISTIHRQREE